MILISWDFLYQTMRLVLMFVSVGSKILLISVFIFQCEWFPPSCILMVHQRAENERSSSLCQKKFENYAEVNN